MIELEINQKHVLQGGSRWRVLRSQAIDTLRQAVARADGRNAP